MPSLDEVVNKIQADPLPYGSILVVLLGFVIVDDPSTRTKILPWVGGFLLAALLYLYKSFTAAAPAAVSTEDILETKSTNQSTSPSNSELKNIWDTSRSDNRQPLNTTHEDKPFGSKYYYAHNNPNATGGYRDGLQMEDYVMNGPRLLRKGGQPVEEEKGEQGLSVETNTGGDDDKPQAQNKPIPDKEKVTATKASDMIPIRTISKYLWDDPGKSNGIATIRIESLPDKNGSQVDWKDIMVDSVSADLKGEGLLIKIETDECRYQLNISKLYGDAAEVRTVIKPKRLMVRIVKKKVAVLASHKESNLDAWPRLYRSI